MSGPDEQAAEPKLTVVQYSDEGLWLGQQHVRPGIEDDWGLQLAARLRRLSRDLELPLEIPLPGPSAQYTLRICASPTAAYTIYYRGDEPLFASLLLAGADEETEDELLLSFRFLLLDTGDEDEPDEELLAAMEAATEFDFAAEEERPVLYQIPFIEPTAAELSEKQIPQRDQVLAAVFLAVSGVSPWDQLLDDNA